MVILFYAKGLSINNISRRGGQKLIFAIMGGGAGVGKKLMNS